MRWPNVAWCWGEAMRWQAAVNAADFILAQMSQPDGRLYRSYKDGRARFNAYLEDYAAFDPRVGGAV